MKASTLMTSVLLSASCFAAPVRTAQDAPAARAETSTVTSARPVMDEAPVAPPAPDVPAFRLHGPQHWVHLTLPKSRRLDETLTPDLHEQT